MPDEAPVTRATFVVMVVGPFEGPARAAGLWLRTVPAGLRSAWRRRSPVRCAGPGGVRARWDRPRRRRARRPTAGSSSTGLWAFGVDLGLPRFGRDGRRLPIRGQDRLQGRTDALQPTGGDSSPLAFARRWLNTPAGAAA